MTLIYSKVVMKLDRCLQGFSECAPFTDSALADLAEWCQKYNFLLFPEAHYQQILSEVQGYCSRYGNAFTGDLEAFCLEVYSESKMMASRYPPLQYEYTPRNASYTDAIGQSTLWIPALVSVEQHSKELFFPLLVLRAETTSTSKGDSTLTTPQTPQAP
ncbi:hypothetical protein Pelo_11975 [Pelomyxa schiedti]|nr:hypothetical protein Pelo_11975 [Pelomyxa schiedti]